MRAATATRIKKRPRAETLISKRGVLVEWAGGGLYRNAVNPLRLVGPKWQATTLESWRMATWRSHAHVGSSLPLLL